MKWFQKKAVILMISFLGLGIWLPVVQAGPIQNSDLIKITVNITIENPDYFWKYPFLGKEIDGIRISGMGQSFFIRPTSSGERVEFDVPKNYRLKIALELQNNNETVKETRYSTKRGVDDKKNTLEILLKAPGPQSIILTTADFEEIRGK